MARQKSQASNRPQQTTSRPTDPAKAKRERSDRDDANKRRFIDQRGIVAQDLPDAGHGHNAVPDVNELKRTLPQQHGGADNEEGGLRAQMPIGDADRFGGRKHN
jgi:hypothetical protein